MSGLVAGLDVGGTKILGILVDPADPVDFRSVERKDTPTDPEELVASIAEVVSLLDGEVTAVGVGMAGLVDARGVVRTSPNLPGVADLDVRSRLGDEVGVPVSVDNDATSAALAEARVGAGRGCDEMVLVTVGTGIGGGVISGGEVRRGANGYAGEFGHMIVEPGGVRCVCGRQGCWERYASGSALERLGHEYATTHGVEVTLSGAPITGEHLIEAARARVDGALAVVEIFAGHLGRGVANLVAALDPKVVVLGGGVMDGDDVLLDRVREVVDRELFGARHRPRLEIRVAELGSKAGAVGAALLAAVGDPEE